MLLVCSAGPALAAPVVSDRLVVLERDAHSYTVQHTLLTEAVLVSLTLPDALAPEHIRFGGPQRASFERLQAARPDHLSLWSGSVLARYRHHYKDQIEQLAPDHIRLRVPSVPDQLQADLFGTRSRDIESVQSWIFPDTMEPLTWRVIKSGPAPGTVGTWALDGNRLEWTQYGLESHELQIDFRLLEPPAEAISTDAAPAERDLPDPKLAAASPRIDTRTASTVPEVADVDADSVPDVRDVCLQPGNGAADDVDRLGCTRDQSRVLADVRFRSGRSSLDLRARRQLNRTARALVALPDTTWEIAGFTDNAGAASNNRTLSTRRAEAVRHYLLLRGVPAGQVQARGYGEDTPIADNASADGRSANRRIELRHRPPERSIAQ